MDPLGQTLRNPAPLGVYARGMIGRLRGTLIQKAPNLALVECAGVGYSCAISLGTYASLPEVEAEVVLHTEVILRENELSLIGFGSTLERDLYRLLIKVDGIGPRLALAALGALPLNELIVAIRGRDVKALTRIPGVGKKTAEKLCFELSEKLGGLSGLDGLDAAGQPRDSWEADLRSALTNLGFKEDALGPVLTELRSSRPPLPEAIRLALRGLQR